MIFVDGPFYELHCDRCEHRWQTPIRPDMGSLRCPNEDGHSENHGSSSVVDLYRDMPETTPLRAMIDPGWRFPRAPG